MENEAKQEIKKRRTLDQYIGINGLCVIAIGSIIFGWTLEGILKPIGAAAGISAVYYLIKKRKELASGQKWTGWILVVIWLMLSSIFSNQ